VLEKHWPNVQRFNDIRECCGSPLRISRDDMRCAECGRRDFIWRPDIITGGFPCQDISVANTTGKGLDGERSGLWSEMWRVVRQLRPRIVVVENVANLLNRGIGRILAELASIGYDAEWDCLPACSFGAHHIRDRVWIIAYPASDLRRASRHDRPKSSDGRDSLLADAASAEMGTRPGEIQAGAEPNNSDRFGDGYAAYGGYWTTEPNVGRVAHGIPARVDRLKGLGNSLVPQIAEWIGRRIVAAYEGGGGHGNRE
jgi:DNA (cytosine-5)-methyltransferase 1